MSSERPSTWRQSSVIDVEVCLGIVAHTLFRPDSNLPGRPSLDEFISSPAMRHADINDLGIDSLAWMALLTSLEQQLQIEFPDHLLISDVLTVEDIAQAIAHLLSGRAGDQTEPRQLVSCGENYQIVDNFLPPEVLDGLQNRMHSAEFRHTDSVVDAVVDGAAYCSVEKVLKFDDRLALEMPQDAFQAILDTIRDCPTFFGKAGLDWSILSFAFWKYPAGTRLGWHDDVGGGRTGEFILYIHEEWHPSWGGELLLLDHAVTEGSLNDEENNPFKRLEVAVENTPGALAAIAPKPNRLVLMKAGTPHAINRVDQSAGATARCSLAGFVAGTSADHIEHQSKLDQLSALMGWELAAPEEGMRKKFVSNPNQRS